jgi:hypothetical protein
MENDKIRILILTPVLPSKISFRIAIVNEIIRSLVQKNIEIIWLVHLPDKITSFPNQTANIVDIHDFTNGANLLNKINPDAVIVGSTYDPIQESISMAANFLKIPLISLIYMNTIWLLQLNHQKNWNM